MIMMYVKRIIACILAVAIVVAMALWASRTITSFNSYTPPEPKFNTTWSKTIQSDVIADYYVSTNGSDDNDGSRDHPFLTINRAISAVKETNKEGREEIVVGVLEGIYNTSSLTFDFDRSCKTRFVGVGDVSVNLGTRLDGHDFKPVSDYPDIECRIQSEVRDRVMVLDLTSEGYKLTKSDWGNLYPIGTYNTADRYEGDTTGPMYSELFINDERQTLARYPNEGYLRIGKVITIGKNSETDPLCSDTIRLSEELGERVAGWKDIQSVWMYGFPMYDWADSSTPVASFDPETLELTTKYQSMFGVWWNKPYHFYNCLEELDCQGEWYLDRERGLLCVYSTDDFESAEITLSTSLSSAINIHCDNFTLDGFTVTGARGNGIMAYGNNIKISNCTVKNISGSAVIMEGCNNEISCCEIFNIGRDGIAMTGGERVTLTPSGNKVYNNLIHDWAEVFKTYRAGINISGVGNLCANNELYDAPHMAITYSGNNNIIEYNLMHDVCRESDDGGAIYAGLSWSSYGNEIRYNCIYNIGTEGYAPSGVYMDDALSGQSIYGNIFVNIPKSAFFIGGGRDLKITNNLIINCGNNPIFYDARARSGTLSRTWFTPNIDGLLHDLGFSPWQSEIWQTAYPQYSDITVDLSQVDSPSCIVNPANSVISGNMIFHKTITIGDIDKYVRENGTVRGNLVSHLSALPFFFKNYEEGDYTLRMGEMLGIPIDKIGRQ